MNPTLIITPLKSVNITYPEESIWIKAEFEESEIYAKYKEVPAIGKK